MEKCWPFTRSRACSSVTVTSVISNKPPNCATSVSVTQTNWCISWTSWGCSESPGIPCHMSPIGIGVLFPECNEDVKYSHRQQPRTYLAPARTNPASELMQARRTIRASSGRGTGRQASDNPANLRKRDKVGRACYELRRPAGYPS